MADAGSKGKFETLVELLAAEGVKYVVIGGRAEQLYGSDRMTQDTDLCYERSAANLERLARVLTQISAKLRGAPPDVPFRPDARTLQAGMNFTFLTDLGDVDILGYVEPLGEFDRVTRHAAQMTVGQTPVSIIGLDDLIATKRHINRPKDQLSLMHLLAIKRVLEGGRKPSHGRS